MTTSIRLPSRLTSWASSYSSDSIVNLKNVSYAVAGLFLLITGVYLTRKIAFQAKIDSFCRRRHVTFLQKNPVCINDSIYLRFDKKFAQGFVKIEPENLITTGLTTLYLYFRYKNHCFDFQRVPIEQLSHKLFIQNLPYQEEVTLQIFKTEDKDEKPLWEKTFKVDHPLAEYQIKAENNIPTLTAQPYSHFTEIKPLSLYSYSIGKSSKFVIDENKVSPMPCISREDHYVFENSNPHMIKLNLGFSFDPSQCFVDHQEASRYMILPVIVASRSTTKLSKEFILQRFRDIFLRAMPVRGKDYPPENPKLRLTNIQLISYFPENHGK